MPLDGASSPSLADEARHFHASLFSRNADPSVVTRYEAAHRQAFPNEIPSAAVTRVVARRLDVEAVEFALRRRGAGRQLTRKIQVLCYLVEVRSDYFSLFLNDADARTRAWLALAGETLRTGWKLVKGEFLVRRHGLL